VRVEQASWSGFHLASGKNARSKVTGKKVRIFELVEGYFESEDRDSGDDLGKLQ